VIRMCGSHRKYAIGLLGRAAPPRPSVRRVARRRPTYSAEVMRLVAQIWEAAGYLCGQRLKAAMPHWLPWLRRRVRFTPTVAQRPPVLRHLKSYPATDRCVICKSYPPVPRGVAPKEGEDGGGWYGPPVEARMACFRCLLSLLIGGSFRSSCHDYSTEGATYSKFNGLQPNLRSTRLPWRTNIRLLFTKSR
jgi:hypothetical protein